MVMIEKVGQKKIGFSCWKSFIINYSHAYEVGFVLFLIRKTPNPFYDLLNVFLT